MSSTQLWVGLIIFNVFVLAMLALDLGVFHRKAHEVRFGESVMWVGVWVSLALLFCVGIYLWYPQNSHHAALQFLAAYVVEESLSVDNIFVFLLIFRYFRVPRLYQHRVLFWGIIGVLVMRATFIIVGIALIERLHWIIYVFAGFLIITGVKMAFQAEKEIHPERNPVLRLMRRFFPIWPEYVGGKFFVRMDGRLFATPLLVVLLVIETTDVAFAVDSIPAVLAITTDRFIVYTSNIFAILGLRSLYFALAGFMAMFRYLHYGLAGVLVFVGVKMLLSETRFEIHIGVSLAVIVSLLAISVIASIIAAKREGRLKIEPEPLVEEGPPPPIDGDPLK